MVEVARAIGLADHEALFFNLQGTLPRREIVRSTPNYEYRVHVDGAVSKVFDSWCEFPQKDLARLGQCSKFALQLATIGCRRCKRRGQQCLKQKTRRNYRDARTAMLASQVHNRPICFVEYRADVCVG